MRDHLIGNIIIFGALGWVAVTVLIVAFFKGASGGPAEPEDSRSVKEWLGDPFDAPTSFREVPVTKQPTPLPMDEVRGWWS